MNCFPSCTKGLRFCSSYFALYGDPLLEADTDPFPDGYLEKLARCGINGVWIQTVLNTLAPSQQFPEFGAGWETRLRNLGAANIDGIMRNPIKKASSRCTSIFGNNTRVRFPSPAP